LRKTGGVKKSVPDTERRIYFANAGFSRYGCRGRGSNAAPSPTTPSWLKRQRRKTWIQGVKTEGSDPPKKDRIPV
jgi:hypothetical protein